MPFRRDFVQFMTADVSYSWYNCWMQVLSYLTPGALDSVTGTCVCVLGHTIKKMYFFLLFSITRH